MISKIDWFFNRVLFAIYDVLGFMFCWLVWGIYILFYPFSCIPFIKRIRKYLETKGYKSSERMPREFSPYKSPKAFQLLYSKREQFSSTIFFLPISTLINILLITVARPLQPLYSDLKGIILLLIITLGPSFLLTNYFFWKKDRHYSFIPIFLKEPLLKRVAWDVGTCVALTFLLIIDLWLLGLII